ncbi:putative sugar phosphate/phosphate translocator [Zea mays]|uniref:Putative sugar phosphate/phosphate translocator n=1 Tax=Zea mays TaxID=4577 RepID=A0A3L6E7K8_MAIZE|nr:putative sugar phosphate/phosphate translocator [Zea mays]
MHPKPEGGGDDDGAAAEVGSPRSGYFRQRSMHAAAAAADPEAARRPFHVENPPCSAGGGLRPSESVTKLESLERAALAPAVVLRTGFYILVWYAFSTCLTLYNKTLLGDKLGKFPAPLLMNTVHFALQAGLSKLIIWFQPKGPEAAVDMGWKDYFMRVVPTALGTALDINLSNASLVFISVTFATMCKSASPIFLLLFAFAFRLENPSIKLLGIIVVISTGVLLTVSKETEFDFWGFIFVTLAAVMSGFRWSMTQILLQVLTEYILISATSAITVTIAGVVKEAVTILVAVFYFHDEFTWLKGFGLFTIMVGVSLFNWYKYERFKRGQINEDDVSSPFTGDVKYIIIDDLEYQNEFEEDT